MKIASIASGSSGNSIYVGTDCTHLLIDTGISKKRVEEGLKSHNICPSDVNGIFITHEHSDHIGGLGVMARKYGIPIYGTKETLDAVKSYKYLGAVPDELFISIEPEKDFTIGDIVVKPFQTSHDAANPVAYRMESAGRSVAVVTDLGYYTDYTVSKLQNLDAVLLEANHDIKMLEAGSYPYYLKRRILSNRGHLSNETAGKLLCEILHDGMKHIFLGHLSKENNYPDLAYETVRLEITMCDKPYKANDFKIEVANRDRVSGLIQI